MTPNIFEIHSIGLIRQLGEQAQIDIHPQFEAALLGLDQFSHIWVLYWFHNNDTPEKRSTLQVHPRANPANPLTGVFATHSPVRPN
ncbi:MAG: TrmO family methyltransferase, partial [Desulfobacterales bacterium]